MYFGTAGLEHFMAEKGFKARDFCVVFSQRSEAVINDGWELLQTLFPSPERYRLWTEPLSIDTA